MNRKVYIVLFLLFVFTIKSKAQSMIEYKGINIYDFKSTPSNQFIYADSLHATAEWFVTIKNTNLNNLTETELNEIVKYAKKYDCFMVYLSLEKKEIFGKKSNQVYVLGFERKK